MYLLLVCIGMSACCVLAGKCACVCVIRVPVLNKHSIPMQGSAAMISRQDYQTITSNLQGSTHDSLKASAPGIMTFKFNLMTACVCMCVCMCVSVSVLGLASCR